MTEPLRIGVIGLGRAGAMMLAAMARHPDIRVTAAADLHRQHLERFHQDFGGLTFSDAAALCASPDVDVVYVASPHEYHVEHAVLAAGKRKHVLVEKPMALTLEDCDRMIEAAERAGVVLIVGHTASFNPGVQKMRQLIASGEVGRLALISATAYTDFLYRPRRPEELLTERGGGIMYNQVPHQVDAARLVAGGLARTVRAATWSLDPARPTEGCYAAFLTFEDGAVASLVYSGYDHLNSAELAAGRGPTNPRRYGAARRALRAVHSPDEEVALRVSSGYAGQPTSVSGSDADQPTTASGSYAGQPRTDNGSYGDQPTSANGSRQRLLKISMLQAELGVFVATCAEADLRLAPEGVAVYATDGLQVVPPDPWRGLPGRGAVLDELYYAVTAGRPVVHDGRWAKATMEVCLAMLRSAREQREIALRHQVPTRDILLRTTRC